MRESLQRHNTKRSSAYLLAGEADIITSCPKCGGEVSIWSEEPETLCIFCQYHLFEKEKTIH